MDYPALAQELLALRAAFNHLPAGEALTEMSGGEHLALRILLSHGAGAHPSELSSAMHVSTARIAALLRRLEQKNWICRSHDTEDERRVIITLTPLGRNLIVRRQAEALSCICKLLRTLDPKDAEEYLRLQRKLLAADKSF